MNTTVALLFHLDISLDHLAKLRAFYYYIPENKVQRLKVGGFVYVVERSKAPAPLRYLGILVAVTATELTVRGSNDKVIHTNVHVFYRPPQTTKTKKHLLLLLDETA